MLLDRRRVEPLHHRLAVGLGDFALPLGNGCLLGEFALDLLLDLPLLILLFALVLLAGLLRLLELRGVLLLGELEAADDLLDHVLTLGEERQAIHLHGFPVVRIVLQTALGLPPEVLATSDAVDVELAGRLRDLSEVGRVDEAALADLLEGERECVLLLGDDADAFLILALVLLQLVDFVVEEVGRLLEVGLRHLELLLRVLHHLNLLEVLLLHRGEDLDELCRLGEGRVGHPARVLDDGRQRGRDLQVEHLVVADHLPARGRLGLLLRRVAVVVAVGARLVLVQVVEEDLVLVVELELLDVLRGVTVDHMDALLDALQGLQPLGLLLPDHVELLGGPLRLGLDLVEEGEELLRVLLEHGLGAAEAVLLHVRLLGETFDLLLLCLEHHSDEAHLTLLLDEGPAGVTVLRPLDRNVEVGTLAGVDEALDLRVDGELGRLDVGFAYFAQAALSDRFIFLPDLQALVLLAVECLPVLLGFLEGEDHLVEAIDAERVLLVGHGAGAGLRASVVGVGFRIAAFHKFELELFKWEKLDYVEKIKKLFKLAK